MWSDRLNCTGREKTIFDCPHDRVMWSSSCYHSNDVGVQCTGPQKGNPISNQCVKRCARGWFKDDADICKPCAPQCAECIGRSYRCTKCNAPRFQNQTTCIDKCGKDEYGDTRTHQCKKCNTDICMTCADGPDGNNCTSCKAPLALKSGKCEKSCGPDLYQKGGRCVKDCGVSFFKFNGNYSCLDCPSGCLTCTYDSKQVKCITCKPPKAAEKALSACVANCTGGKFLVPLMDVHVDMSPNIRLSNGSDHLEGVLEVFHDGVWGTVCDDGWDSQEAKVVCRQLSLGTPVFVPLTHIKTELRKVWLDDLFCTGEEAHFFDCRHRDWGENNCNHEENVKLRCSGPGIRECQDRCPDGLYARENQCFFCNISCKTCTGQADKCDVCASGYYRNGSTCLTECPVGSFLDVKGSSCHACDPTCTTCSISRDNCTSCAHPRYRSGNKCVLNCTSGYKPSSQPLIRLVKGKTSLEGRVEVSLLSTFCGRAEKSTGQRLVTPMRSDLLTALICG